MPFKEVKSYQPPMPLRNGHLNTILTSQLRKVPMQYERERIDTPDQDFLDLDFSRVGSRTGIIVIHGLGGESGSSYVKGIARTINEAGWDAIALNMRGCSGEENRRYVSYHSGKTDDLATTIAYLETKGDYDQLGVLGFSLGGNVTLKYMGDMGADVPPIVKATAAISVPCDLKAAAIALSKWDNIIYLLRFLKMLKAKAREKLERFPEQATFTHKDIDKVKSFADFDNLYTGPAHGYGNAEGYWKHCSSRFVMPQIQRPSLLLNALDDPFFLPSCFPKEEGQNSKHFHFHQTRYGGHVGYTDKKFSRSWHEGYAVEFLREYLEK